MPDQVYVFGYGSLLEPASLHRTVPAVSLHSCLPATAEGYLRAFDVAFPNDGTQVDKAYYAPDGTRPARVLLANLRSASDASEYAEAEPEARCAVTPEASGAVVHDGTEPATPEATDAATREATDAVVPQLQPAANGICIPVNVDELEALRRRERRYGEVDITDHIRPHSGWPAPQGTVLAFIGSARFTRPADVARGFVSASYLATIRSGAQYWERLVPGFERDYRASTIDPPAAAIASLRRVDVPGGGLSTGPR